LPIAWEITLNFLPNRVGNIVVELEGSGSDATAWLGRWWPTSVMTRGKDSMFSYHYLLPDLPSISYHRQ